MEGGLMAHSFDTGYETPQREVIRAGVIAELEKLKRTGPTSGLYLQTVAGIPSQLQATDEIDDVKRQCGGKIPAALVALGKSTFTPQAVSKRDRFNDDVDIKVYMISTNERKPDLARVAGDVASQSSLQVDPGIETMLEHSLELLNQLTFAPPADAPACIYQMFPQEQDELFHDAEMTVWLQRWSVRLVRAFARDKGITQLVTEVLTTVHQDGAPAEDDRQVLTTLEPA
jgi:hypothetical protein